MKSTPEQRIAADLGITTADLERIVRAERARRLATDLVEAVRDIVAENDRYGGCPPSSPAWGIVRPLLAKIDAPIN